MVPGVSLVIHTLVKPADLTTIGFHSTLNLEA
ncbi:hypothetical protein PsAD37_04842 [Pseudovibrio sp. Ad37]|nr:hypothetical protein PsAD37_04842 [Pseudovibrio sp. Ad37]